MKKLNDIPKKNIYEVPDGYFDKLPGVIQSRVAAKETIQPSFIYYFRYHIQVLVLAIAMIGVWIFRTNIKDDKNAEELLASVDTPSLIAYLEDVDVTTDELLESFSLSTEEVTAIESDVYNIDVDQNELDELLDEYSFELNDF